MSALVREGRVVITPGRGARLWGWEIGYGGYSCQLYAGQLGHVVVFVGIGGKIWKMGCRPSQVHKVFCPKFRAEAVPKIIAGLA